MLNYEYPPLGGGAANANKHILKEFSKHDDIEIDLVTSSISKHKIEVFSENIKIHYLDIGKNDKMHDQSIKDLLMYSYKCHYYCKKLVKKNEYHVIHAFFGIPCGFIARNLKLPYKVSLRGSDVPFFSKKYELLDKLFFRRLSDKIWRDAKYVIANSSKLRDLALESLPGHDILIIPNGVDNEKFYAKKKYSKSKVLKLFSVGRLIERKNYEFVINQLSGIENVELTIAGDGPLKDKLSLLAKEKNVKLNLLGNVNHDDLANHFRDNDVFVLMSKNEGMSNTVLEAISCGLPVIVSNVGGMSELVKDNYNGFIIDNDDDIYDRFLEKVLFFRDNKAKVEEMGIKSSEISKEFSWSNVANEYKKLY